MADSATTPYQTAWTWRAKCTIGLLALLVIIFQLVIIGLLSYPKPKPAIKYTESTWIIQAERGWAPFSDEDAKGELKGFHVELAQKVCDMADMDCAVVTGPANDCFNDNNDLAVAMADKRYDGCIGWSNTQHRQNTALFSQSWSTVPKNGFYAASGNENLVTCDNGKCKLSDDAKLGLVDGWASSEACLKMNDLMTESESIPDSQLFTCEELIPALKDGKINVFFIVLTDGSANPACLNMDQFGDMAITKIGEEHDCAIGGYGVATRKDSNLVKFFNKGFTKFQASGGFAELCQKYNIEVCCSEFDFDTGKCK